METAEFPTAAEQRLAWALEAARGIASPLTARERLDCDIADLLIQLAGTPRRELVASLPRRRLQTLLELRSATSTTGVDRP